jgi:hypothetical protein
LTTEDEETGRPGSEEAWMREGLKAGKHLTMAKFNQPIQPNHPNQPVNAIN